MEVILLKNVEGLGVSGDIIKVKPGYARNYLIPRGLALRSSTRNLAISEEKKRVSVARVERARKAVEELATKLSRVELTIEVQVGEEERVFGSVTAMDIHKALEEKGIEIDRHLIALNEPIKALGIYNVPVNVAEDLFPEVKIYVIKA